MRRIIGILVTLLVMTSSGPGVLAEPKNELTQALKLQPDSERGQDLFDTCAACHQPDGGGVAGSSVADGGIPNIAGQHYAVILKQLADFRDTERLDLRMEAFASRHHLQGPQDLADVAAFISQLPLRPSEDFGNGMHLQQGRQAYERVCLHCHGAAAAGNAKLRYPRLAGQHFRYLVKQIDTMIGGSRFNVSWDHARLLESLTDEEITGVADYLARLPGRTKSRNEAAGSVADD